MTFERYTYRSKKRQGYRQNITVGPRDIFQMKEIENMKQTNLDKLVDFVDRNGCKITAGRIEKDRDGVGCITIWTNMPAFRAWQQENDELVDRWADGVPLPKLNKTHIPIPIPFHSSSLPTSVDTSNGDFCASTTDANDGKTQLIVYSNYWQDLGQQVIQNQNNLGIFSFVAYVYPTSGYSDHDNPDTIKY